MTQISDRNHLDCFMSVGETAMTRYQLLKLIRRLLGSLPGWHHDWMPRTKDGYKELCVFVGSGDVLYRVEIVIERLL